MNSSSRLTRKKSLLGSRLEITCWYAVMLVQHNFGKRHLLILQLHTRFSETDFHKYNSLREAEPSSKTKSRQAHKALITAWSEVERKHNSCVRTNTYWPIRGDAINSRRMCPLLYLNAKSKHLYTVLCGLDVIISPHWFNYLMLELATYTNGMKVFDQNGHKMLIFSWH